MKAQKGGKGVCFRCSETKRRCENHGVTQKLKVVRPEGSVVGDPSPVVSERVG